MAGESTTSSPISLNQAQPSPVAHTALFIISILPLFVPVPTSFNIVITASACVFCGCWRSVKPEPPSDAMTKKDAMKFPIMGSVILLSLFLAFKFLPKDLVNLVLSAYFVLLGTAALVGTLDPLLSPHLPPSLTSEIHIRIPKIPLLLQEGADISFTRLEALLALPATGFCTWYWTTKHWFANNALGLAFSLQGIEHLSLGAVQNGVILLSGLFFYDIFWVFFTPVMVSVAKNFDAPIKLLFPRYPVPAISSGSKFSMLGLGDIVIPGIFVAIILRYDAAHTHLSPPSTTGSSTVVKSKYFVSAMVGYVVGLASTIVVMNVFQAAQPALLYIVPAVLGATFGHAAVNKEVEKVFYWKESSEEVEEDAVESTTKKDT